MGTHSDALLRPHRTLAVFGVGLAVVIIFLQSVLDLVDVSPFKPLLAGFLWVSFVCMLTPVAILWRRGRQRRMVGTGITGHHPSFERLEHALRIPRLLGRGMIAVGIVSLRVAIWSNEETTSTFGDVFTAVAAGMFVVLVPLGFRWVHRVSLAGDLVRVTGWRPFTGGWAKVGLRRRTALWPDGAAHPPVVVVQPPIAFFAGRPVGPLDVCGPNRGPWLVRDANKVHLLARRRPLPKRFVRLRMLGGYRELADVAPPEPVGVQVEEIQVEQVEPVEVHASAEVHAPSQVWETAEAPEPPAEVAPLDGSAAVIDGDEPTPSV